MTSVFIISHLATVDAEGMMHLTVPVEVIITVTVNSATLWLVVTTFNLKLFSALQVLYKVYISFVEVGAENVQTADYFKGVGE